MHITLYSTQISKLLAELAYYVRDNFFIVTSSLFLNNILAMYCTLYSTVENTLHSTVYYILASSRKLSFMISHQHPRRSTSSN